MNAFMWVVLLGLAAHMAALIVTESEIFRDSREFLDRRSRAYASLVRSLDFASELDGGPGADRRERFAAWAWYKLSYLHGCHMCAGTWLSAALAVYIAPISSGFLGWLVSLLAISGARHMWLVAHKLGEGATKWLMRYEGKPPKSSILDRLRQRAGDGRIGDHTHMHTARNYHAQGSAVDFTVGKYSALSKLFAASREQGWPGSPTGRVKVAEVPPFQTPKFSRSGAIEELIDEMDAEEVRQFPRVDGLSDVEVAPETDDEMLARWRAARPADHPRWPRDSFDDEVDLQMARSWASLNPRP